MMAQNTVATTTGGMSADNTSISPGGSIDAKKSPIEAPPFLVVTYRSKYPTEGRGAPGDDVSATLAIAYPTS
ncbi:hypothetical protein GCM10026982_04680 [Nocardiopsis aegyptia]